MFLSAQDLVFFGLICFVLGMLPPIAYNLRSKPKRDERGRFKKIAK
jgi:hypothetical protein